MRVCACVYYTLCVFDWLSLELALRKDSCCMSSMCGRLYVAGALRMDVGISYIGASIGATVKTVVVDSPHVHFFH